MKHKAKALAWALKQFKHTANVVRGVFTAAAAAFAFAASPTLPPGARTPRKAAMEAAAAPVTWRRRDEGEAGEGAARIERDSRRERDGIGGGGGGGGSHHGGVAGAEQLEPCLAI